MIYIFNIDGTLADLTHRLHFIQQQPADWDGFFAACQDDLPIESVISILRALRKADHTILFVSGRSDAVRPATVQWLNHFVGDCDAGLYMRRAGDHRTDDIVKGELLDALAKDWNIAHVAGVFEDRNQVVQMYRGRGLRVFQVAEGNF